MLRAELFLVQRDAAAVRAQLEVLRRQQECRSGNGGGSGATTPRGPASVRPSASSTPVKSLPSAIPEAHVASPSVSVSRMSSPADEQIAQLKVRHTPLCRFLPSPPMAEELDSPQYLVHLPSGALRAESSSGTPGSGMLPSHSGPLGRRVPSGQAAAPLQRCVLFQPVQLIGIIPIPGAVPARLPLTHGLASHPTAPRCNPPHPTPPHPHLPLAHPPRPAPHYLDAAPHTPPTLRAHAARGGAAAAAAGVRRVVRPHVGHACCGAGGAAGGGVAGAGRRAAADRVHAHHGGGAPAGGQRGGWLRNWYNSYMQ